MWFSGWAGWLAGAVVAAFGVDGEVAEDLAGGGVDDADVHVGDEQDDAGCGVGAVKGHEGGEGRRGYPSRSAAARIAAIDSSSCHFSPRA